MHVHLLGGFAVEVDDVAVPEGGWRLRKAKTLVKLLALAPGHRMHREQAMAVLWPDLAPSAAANNLHQVLHVARRQLAGGGVRGHPLRLDDDVLSLCTEQSLQVDVEAFRDAALAAVRSADAEHAREALELYTGQLLPEDLYEDWTEPTRGEIEHLRGELIALAHTRGEVSAAADAQLDNLPTELTTFIGREAELDEIAGLLGRGPLLTLTGSAGCGKTRLAVETAARQRDRFRDGVWLVELAPLHPDLIADLVAKAIGAKVELAPLSQPGLVADAIAAAVGVKLRNGSPATAALVESLKDRELLIVLDNCEHLVAACARLVGALLRECPEVQVLATSREGLRVTGEIVSRVPSLRLPDLTRDDSPGQLLSSESVRLFVDRAAAAQPGFDLTAVNAAEVASICHRLDGVPLAIELAAARVGTLPVSEIATRLGESFRLLHRGRRAAETRQETLEGALDWSHSLLDAEEATLLRRLSVFACDFGLDAARDVCTGGAVSHEEAIDVLLRLVDKSLVLCEESSQSPRYGLLEMVRQYARDRLGESGETDALLERHARWYGELPERLGREGAAPDAANGRLRRFDLETDNLRAALGWLLDQDPPEALNLAASLSEWWLLRGRLEEAREWLEAAVERTPQDEMAAAALLGAMPFADRALAIYRKLGDRAGTANALHMLGLQSWLRGDYPRAGELLEEAIREARLASSPAAEANATHARAILAVSTRDLAGARSGFERTLEMLEGLPEESPPAFLVVSPGHVPLIRGRGPVLGVVQEEFMFGRTVGPRPASAYVGINLALVARLDGDAGSADVLLGNALARLRAVGDEPGIAQALAAIGRLATVEGDRARANEALCESLVMRRRFGDVRSVGLTLALLAELAADEGEPGRGASLLERALTMFHEAGDRPAALWMLWALGRVELLAGSPKSARARLEAGLAISEELGAGTMRAWTLAALAEVDVHAARRDRARVLLKEARSEFDRCGDPWGRDRCEALGLALSGR